MHFDLRRHMFGIEAWTLTVQTDSVTINEDYIPARLFMLRDAVAELLDDIDYHLEGFESGGVEVDEQ